MAAKGLSAAEAAERLKKYGRNELAEKGGEGAASMFLRQFKDLLILILAAATIISVLIGQLTEAVTIIVIVLLNAVMGFIQEYRTERTVRALSGMTAPTARAFRDGALVRLPASELVPGDRISLRAGDRVPADCRVVAGASMSCDESMLTGESQPVQKNAGKPVYMGTGLLTGRGEAEVEKTGMSTEMGGIAGMVSSADEGPTPLQKRLDALGRAVAGVCLAVCAAVALLGVLRGEKLMDMVLTGISLAVAAIPEGLPAIVTVVLALSVNRVLKRGAVIRRLHAVETLGAASVICADKTGTITENRMTASAAFCGLKDYRLDGEAIPTPCDRPLAAAMSCAALCSSGEDGNPTERALLEAAARQGFVRERLLAAQQVVLERPFDSRRKLMSVGVRCGDLLRLYVKGAPDLLLPLCAFVACENEVKPLDQALRDILVTRTDQFAREGCRVIAAAFKQGDTAERGLTFLGLFALRDPPRSEAAPAVARCRRAGIRPVMITGDHRLTAESIAWDVGIMRRGDRVLCGDEIERMGDRELAEVVGSCSVFARVSPRHKLRIVRAYRASGRVVAMTGDGVNDAPAIKEADIGVAMGGSGTDAAKEASSVVILDDNFATIVAAVEEGRIIYRNIKRFIRFMLGSNLGEVLTVLLGMVFGLPAIFLPIQILLINLVTDSLPALALGMEGGGKDLMERPPRPAGESLFAGGMPGTIFLRGAVLALSNLLCFTLVWRMGGGDLALCRSATLITLVLAQMLYVFECRGGLGGLFSCPALPLACLLSLGVTASVVYLPPLQSVFMTSPVGGMLLLPTLGSALLSPLAGRLAAADPTLGER